MPTFILRHVTFVYNDDNNLYNAKRCWLYNFNFNFLAPNSL